MSRKNNHSVNSILLPAPYGGCLLSMVYILPSIIAFKILEVHICYYPLSMRTPVPGEKGLVLTETLTIFIIPLYLGIKEAHLLFSGNTK